MLAVGGTVKRVRKKQRGSTGGGGTLCGSFAGMGGRVGARPAGSPPWLSSLFSGPGAFGRLGIAVVFVGRRDGPMAPPVLLRVAKGPRALLLPRRGAVPAGEGARDKGVAPREEGKEEGQGYDERRMRSHFRLYNSC